MNDCNEIVSTGIVAVYFTLMQNITFKMSDP